MLIEARIKPQVVKLNVLKENFIQKIEWKME